MIEQIEDLILLKSIGRGSFGEVFLSKKTGRKELFATKKIDRKRADLPSAKKYFENEILILNSLRHPNIVRLEELKGTNNYYYLVTEYINGGSLTDCLKIYQKKYGKAFPEEIVQYLMRQIVDAIKYLHSLNIIHRDLKLDNIMINFDNEIDKNNLNMMKGRIKIIDFGFSIHLAKSSLTFSALGTPINMDPIILEKYAKKGGNLNQMGYDIKADIWSLGTICYELLIGKAVFNAETMNDLVKKVENGSYLVPTSVSSEMVSFLNGMLQYEGANRLSAEELSKHPFLTKRISDFTKIDTKRVSKKESNKDLNKNNKTIWAIFNEEDERKLINIKGGRDLPTPEGPIEEDNSHKKYRRSKTSKNLDKLHHKKEHHQNHKNYHKSNTNLIQYPTLKSFYPPTSLYGQNIHPNIYGIRQMPGYQQIPQMQMMPMMQPIGGIQQMRGIAYNPMMKYPTFGVPMAYTYGGGFYSNKVPPNYSTGYLSNNLDNNNGFVKRDDDFNICSIQ